MLLLLPANELTGQQPFVADENGSSEIYDAYQEQLKQNQRRIDGSENAYRQQMRQNQAAQVYMPPVHISPQFPPRGTTRNRSLNGRFNSVQNYAAPAKPAYASLSDEQQQRNPRPRVTKRPRQSVVQPPRQNLDTRPQTARADATSSTEHVFLQDRIATALSRKFSRKTNKSEPVFAPITLSVNERQSADSFGNEPLEKPTLEPIEMEQYAFNEADKWFNKPIQATTETSSTKLHPANDGLDVADAELAESIRSVWERSDTGQQADATEQQADATEQQADFQTADSQSPSLSIAKNTMQDASRVVTSSYEAKRRRRMPTTDDAFPQVAKRTRRMTSPRPTSYRAKQNKLRAREKSIFVSQEKEDALEDLDFDLPLDRERVKNSLSDDEFSPPQRTRRSFDNQPQPEQRDDLESIEDEDLENDRIRSRLDDELDDLDDLDDFDDDEIDNERPEVKPPTDRPCNDFREELLSTSIRDISLDISPLAYSETSRYGGPSRQWTDRSGNVIASGMMVDLRRGYVILDGGQKIPYAKLGAADLATISEFWRLPTVCLLGNRGGSPYRNWASQTVTWKASSLCHKPLYFENRQLERYGHSRGPFAQPIHSTVHFFTSLVSLPYQTAITPANECQYALGFFRPGDCAPWLKDPVPISLKAASRQALLTTGGAFIP